MFEFSEIILIALEFTEESYVNFVREMDGSQLFFTRQYNVSLSQGTERKEGETE